MVFTCFSFPSFGFSAETDSVAQEKPAQSTQEKPAESTEEKAGKPLDFFPSPDSTASPVKTETLDEAGKVLGKKIDEVGRGASRTFGRWVNAKAFWGITWLKLFACLLLLLAVLAVDRVVGRIIAARIQPPPAEQMPDRPANWLQLSLEALSKPLSLFIRVYGVYWALSPLLNHFEWSDGKNLVHTVASTSANVGGTIALFWFVYRFVNVVDFRLRRWSAASQSSVNDMLVPLVGKSLRVFIMVIGGIMIVQNMTGIQFGPIIASLGIGGLAFALAGKDSIANFLGSLTILLDKPFQVGDRIVIADNDGVVEQVGFRSTRLRTMKGHLVSIPNEKIINSTLENIGQRPHIRWHANLTVTYTTPPEKMERAVEIIQEILRDHEGMREDFPPRVNFSGFNDWSLNIAIYAWYHPPNFWDYQAWLQKTCLEIMRQFEAEGIEFAFPTQTLYHVGEGQKDVPALPADRETAEA
jgi:MscS family membrane protein